MALGTIGTILAIVGAGMSAASTYQQGQNAKDVAEWNADLQTRNAEEARLKAESDVKLRMDQAEQLKGRQRLAYAAAGVDITTGTPLDSMMQTARDAELDAENIRQGGELTARNYISDAQLLRYQGRSTEQAATIGAGTTILKGATNAFDMYQNMPKKAKPVTTTNGYGGVTEWV